VQPKRAAETLCSGTGLNRSFVAEVFWRSERVDNHTLILVGRAPSMMLIIVAAR
jgi:hypothetical protein